jgi:hypothetical protein
MPCCDAARCSPGGPWLWVPALQDENLENIRTLALYMTETKHVEGAEIVAQGSAPEAMSFVLSGRALTLLPATSFHLM